VLSAGQLIYECRCGGVYAIGRAEVATAAAGAPCAVILPCDTCTLAVGLELNA
jgi:hypothetical protein